MGSLMPRRATPSFQSSQHQSVAIKRPSRTRADISAVAVRASVIGNRRLPWNKLPSGNTGLTTSRIGLGTWAIGGWMWGGTDEAESIATIHSAIDRGITLIDTAPAYGFGRSEEIVGKALARLAARQGQIATKVGLTWQDGRCFATPARRASARRSRIRCAGCAPMSSISTRCTGRTRDTDRGDRADAGGPAPRGQDPRDRRQQLLARADGRFRAGAAGCRAAALQPV